MVRDADVDDSSCGMLDDDKHKNGSKPEIMRLQEVTCPDGRGVIVDKRDPGLIAWPRRATPFQIFLDRAPGNRQPQLQQFTADA